MLNKRNPTPVVENGHGGDQYQSGILISPKTIEKASLFEYFWLHVKDDGSEYFAGRDYAPGLMRGRGVHAAYNGLVEDTFTLEAVAGVYPRPAGADWFLVGHEVVPAGHVNACTRYARWRRIRRVPLRYDDPTLLVPGRWLP